MQAVRLRQKQKTTTQQATTTSNTIEKQTETQTQVQTGTSTGLITQQESLAVVKLLLQTGLGCVTFLRGVFPERCFKDEKIDCRRLPGGNERKPNKNGRSAVRVKALQRGIHPPCDEVLDYLDHGVSDALAKGYLKTLMMAIYLDPANPTNVVELYTFNFAYRNIGPDGAVRVPELEIRDQLRDMSLGTLGHIEEGAARSAEPIPEAWTAGMIRSQVQSLVRRLILITQTLDELPPKRYLNFKLYYTDETPEEYEPPHFHPVDAENMHFTFGTKTPAEQPDTEIVGRVDTGHHSLTLRLASVSHATPDQDELRQAGGTQSPVVVEASQRPIVWDGEEPVIDDAADVSFETLEEKADKAKLRKPIGQLDEHGILSQLPAALVELNDGAMHDEAEAPQPRPESGFFDSQQRRITSKAESVTIAAGQAAEADFEAVDAETQYYDQPFNPPDPEETQRHSDKGLLVQAKLSADPRISSQATMISGPSAQGKHRHQRARAPLDRSISMLSELDEPVMLSQSLTNVPESPPMSQTQLLEDDDSYPVGLGRTISTFGYSTLLRSPKLPARKEQDVEMTVEDDIEEVANSSMENFKVPFPSQVAKAAAAEVLAPDSMEDIADYSEPRESTVITQKAKKARPPLEPESSLSDIEESLANTMKTRATQAALDLPESLAAAKFAFPDIIMADHRAKAAERADEKEVEDKVEDKPEEHIRCDCDSLEEDGNDMICCDSCDNWVHFICYGLRGPEAVAPEKFTCHYCLRKSHPSGDDSVAATEHNTLALFRRFIDHAWSTQSCVPRDYDDLVDDNPTNHQMRSRLSEEGFFTTAPEAATKPATGRGRKPPGRAVSRRSKEVIVNNDPAFIARMTAKYFTLDGEADQEIYEKTGLTQASARPSGHTPWQRTKPARITRSASAVRSPTTIATASHELRSADTRRAESPELPEILAPVRSASALQRQGSRLMQADAAVVAAVPIQEQVELPGPLTATELPAHAKPLADDAVPDTQASTVLSMPEAGGLLRAAVNTGVLTPSKKRPVDQQSPGKRPRIAAELKTWSTPPSRSILSPRQRATTLSATKTRPSYPLSASAAAWKPSAYSQISAADSRKRQKKASVARGVEGIEDADEDAMEYSDEEGM